jgi:hypothetical protein
MNEEGWLSCTDPEAMLDWLRKTGRLSERKAVLFVAACLRRVWPLLTDERTRRAVAVAERHADGLADARERMAAKAELEQARTCPDRVAASCAKAAHHALLGRFSTLFAASAYHTTVCLAVNSIEVVPSEGPTPWGSMHQASYQANRAAICRLIRCIFAPYGPSTINPTWRTPEILALAQSVYDAWAFDRLPDLAALLEAAGCNDAGILEHLRSAGPHVRGCHAIDTILQKG